MNGQMIAFNDKQNIVDEFISKVDPYQKPEPLKFDLRGYAEYLKNNGMSGKQVPETIIKQFQR